MADLFELEDLPAYLQVPDVDAYTADLLRRMVTGWVTGATGGRDFTIEDTVPADIAAWALELAALAYANPQRYQSETVGPYSVSRGSGDARQSILDRIAARYGPASALGVGSVRMGVWTVTDPPCTTLRPGHRTPWGSWSW